METKIIRFKERFIILNCLNCNGRVLTSIGENRPKDCALCNPAKWNKKRALENKIFECLYPGYNDKECL